MIRARLVTIACILALVVAFGCSGDSEPQGTADSSVKKAQSAPGQPKHEKCFLAFGGGPTGGTFNFFANKMSSIITGATNWLDVSPKGSGGSAENLRALNKGAVDMGIVYSGDAFLGRRGELPMDSRKYDKVLALAFLYGAPAQLVVRRDSGIRSVEDLKGRTVAVGNPGSGAALSAERFFKHLGLWDKIQHKNLGYSQAASDFSEGKVDAFWVLVGCPNSAIIEAASHTDIALLDLDRVAEESGFYKAFPFYTPVELPGGVYAGQDQPVRTFQDSALWCASAGLAPAVAEQCLADIFSEQGLKSMATAHKAAAYMSVRSGINGVSIPLHPGAIRFWTSQGLNIPENLRQPGGSWAAAATPFFFVPGNKTQRIRVSISPLDSLYGVCLKAYNCCIQM